MPPELEHLGNDEYCPFHLPLDGIDRRGQKKADWEDANIEAFNAAILQFVNAAQIGDRPVDLSGVVFAGPVEFAQLQFSVFLAVQANFADMVAFEKVIFENGATFEDTTFGCTASFRNTKFCSQAIFWDAIFEQFALFSSAIFDNVAGFSNATFCHLTMFQNSKFSRGAYFNGATFCDFSDFTNVNFADTAFFEGAKFGGPAMFDGSLFQRSAYFGTGARSQEAGSAKILNDISFSGAKFSNRAVFTNRQFENRTNFSSTTFEVAPELHGCTLHQDTDFRDTKFLDRTGNGDVNAARAYRTLRLAMENVRAREEQARFYAYEQQALRNSGQITGLARLFSWLYEKTSYYGQSLSRPAWGLGVVLTVSALVYAVIFALVMRPIDAMVMPEWSEGIRFSLEQIRPFSALFGSGTAAQSVFGERAPLWLAAIAALQSLSIYGFLALFFLALRWRFKRD